MPEIRLTDPTPDEQVQVWLQDQLQHLVHLAESTGFAIEITHRPREPLAMGNFAHVVDVRPARKRA